MPSQPDADTRFYELTWARPSVDIHGIDGGSAALMNTVIPSRASACLSLRLVPGQEVEAMTRRLSDLVVSAAPAGADVYVELLGSSAPVSLDRTSRPLTLASEAFKDVFGVAPTLIRSGASIPILAAMAERGVPTILTGFCLPDSNLHAPNERLRARHLVDGIAAASATLRKLGALCDQPKSLA